MSCVKGIVEVMDVFLLVESVEVDQVWSMGMDESIKAQSIPPGCWKVGNVYIRVTEKKPNKDIVQRIENILRPTSLHKHTENAYWIRLAK